jgi:hypothetical protein
MTEKHRHSLCPLNSCFNLIHGVFYTVGLELCVVLALSLINQVVPTQHCALTAVCFLPPQHHCKEWLDRPCKLWQGHCPKGCCFRLETDDGGPDKRIDSKAD